VGIRGSGATAVHAGKSPAASEQYGFATAAPVTLAVR
jgi:hypothetical protein